MTVIRFGGVTGTQWIDLDEAVQIQSESIKKKTEKRKRNKKTAGSKMGWRKKRDEQCEEARKKHFATSLKWLKKVKKTKLFSPVLNRCEPDGRAPPPSASRIIRKLSQWTVATLSHK